MHKITYLGISKNPKFFMLKMINFVKYILRLFNTIWLISLVNFQNTGQVKGMKWNHQKKKKMQFSLNKSFNS